MEKAKTKTRAGPSSPEKVAIALQAASTDTPGISLPSGAVSERLLG